MFIHKLRKDLEMILKKLKVTRHHPRERVCRQWDGPGVRSLVFKKNGNWKLGDIQQETMKFKVSLTVLKKRKERSKGNHRGV